MPQYDEFLFSKLSYLVFTITYMCITSSEPVYSCVVLCTT